jgi:predicted Zn-dependent protease
VPINHCHISKGYGFVKLFSQLRKVLLNPNSFPNIRRSGPTSEGRIETMWDAQRRIKVLNQESPTLQEMEAIQAAEMLADE